MIPFGPFRPDAATLNAPLVVEAKNVLPSSQGFRPLAGPVPVTSALTGRCYGAVTAQLSNGVGKSFAGDTTKLYRLSTDTSWIDASRTVGGPYTTAAGERWRFELFGNNLLALNFTDVPQKIDAAAGVNFTALLGAPPRARFLAIVRDFVVLGCLFGNERRIHWSSINNAEEWIPGTNSGDIQDFPSGGPVRGIVGGEVGYIFQDDRVSRMTFAPGTAAIFQFDEVEGGRGLKAANSLIRLGTNAYYFGGDGFYQFDLVSGASQPIGSNKWRQWFIKDLRPGTEGEMLSAISPKDRVIMWPYISRNNGSTTPDRVVIYDWTLDEATYAVIDVEAAAQWLTAGYTLDTINSFGSLDTLPYSLDAPFWKSGTALLGLFGKDHKLSYLQGPNLAAEFWTGEGQESQRMLIRGTRPHIDAAGTQVAVGMRERDADPVVFGAYEAMEDTGDVPAFASGNIAEARITIPAGANWTYAKGLTTDMAPMGSR